MLFYKNRNVYFHIFATILLLIEGLIINLSINSRIREICTLFLFISFFIIILVITKGNLYDLKIDKEIKKSLKIIILITLGVIVLIKLLGTIKARYWLKYIPIPTLKERSFYFLLFLFGAFFEEVLFKKLYFDLIFSKLRTKIPTIFIMILCSLIFFFYHFDFTIYNFLATFLFQMFTLFLYLKWSNIYVYIIFHFLYNFSMYC